MVVAVRADVVCEEFVEDVRAGVAADKVAGDVPHVVEGFRLDVSEPFQVLVLGDFSRPFLARRVAVDEVAGVRHVL
jgi:hypothetical protein